MVSKIGTDYLNGQPRAIYLLVGTACRDAEVKMLSGGEKCVNKVSVACGQKKNSESIFVTVNCWNRKAKLLNSCRKGDQVIAVGPINQHEYNGKNYSNMDAEFASVASLSAGDLSALAERAAGSGVSPVNVSAADWEEVDGDDELPF